MNTFSKIVRDRKIKELQEYLNDHKEIVINNQEFINANNKLSYSENFLNMIFGSAVNNTLFVKALDKIFTLHADHEQNASTAAVRLVGSAGSNLFASLSAGVATLWGPSP